MGNFIFFVNLFLLILIFCFLKLNLISFFLSLSLLKSWKMNRWGARRKREAPGLFSYFCFDIFIFEFTFIFPTKKYISFNFVKLLCIFSNNFKTKIKNTHNLNRNLYLHLLFSSLLSSFSCAVLFQEKHGNNFLEKQNLHTCRVSFIFKSDNKKVNHTI